MAVYVQGATSQNVSPHALGADPRKAKPVSGPVLHFHDVPRLAQPGPVLLQNLETIHDPRAAELATRAGESQAMNDLDLQLPRTLIEAIAKPALSCHGQEQRKDQLHKEESPT